jgi:MFS family permease
MTRGAFRHKGFRQLLAAQIPADAADWLDLVAIGALLAFVWEAPPVAFAWFAVAMGLPYLTVGLIAGVYVDRWPLQRTMILANLGRATGTLALILAPDWQVLVAIVALREVADSFFSPAKQAALQALVPVNDLPGANGLSQAINQGSKIVAPALGGVLLAATEPQAVFAINAGFSVAAALLLIRLPDLPRRLKRDITPSVLADLRAGFAMLAARPVLRGCVVVMAASVFAVFFYDTLLAPLTGCLATTLRISAICLRPSAREGLREVSFSSACTGHRRHSSGSPSPPLPGR